MSLYGSYLTRATMEQTHEKLYAIADGEAKKGLKSITMRR